MRQRDIAPNPNAGCLETAQDVPWPTSVASFTVAGFARSNRAAESDRRAAYCSSRPVSPSRISNLHGLFISMYLIRNRDIS